MSIPTVTPSPELELHYAALMPAFNAVRAHDDLRRELAQAMKLQAEADLAARLNLAAVRAGAPDPQLQAAHEAATQALVELRGGFWAALFFFMTSDHNELTYDRNRTH